MIRAGRRGASPHKHFGLVRCVIATGILCAAGTLVIWIEREPIIDLNARHGLLHVNCPPGSHGRPRFLGVGADIARARDASRALRATSDGKAERM